MNEAIGTVGVICPAEAPLLGFLSLVMPLLAMGNTVVAVPSEKYPLITGDLYQLFDTSDLPGGAVNIVTGYASQLLKTLAEHDDVDAIWCFGDEATVAAAKAMSIGNLKQVWTNEGRAIDWFDPKVARGAGSWNMPRRSRISGFRTESRKSVELRSTGSRERLSPHFSEQLDQHLHLFPRGASIPRSHFIARHHSLLASSSV